MEDSDAAEPPLPSALLASLAAMPAPRGFAHGVIRATKGRRRWLRPAAAAAVVGLCVSATILLGERSGAGGAVIATSRRTVELGHGTTAVVEPGTRMQWSRSGDATRVEQEGGSVFYRVDRGAAFSVETPSGRVSGSGSFRVEVSPMNDKKSLAAVGGLAAAGILIATVYEGSIDVRDGERSRSAGAGEIVAFGDSSASDDERSTGLRDREAGGEAHLASAVSARLIEAQQEALDLQRKIDEIERNLADHRDPGDRAAPAPAPAGETAEQRADRCFTRGGIGCSFVDPEKAVLQRLAQHCNVWVDHPDIFGPDATLEPSAQLVEDADLSPDEAAAWASANRDYVAEYERRLQAAFVEMGGAADLAAAMPASALEGMMWEMISEEDSLRIIAAVARDRAGQPSPSPVLETPGGRWMRGMLDGGADYEAFLAERLGPDRARMLRRLHDGWDDKSTFGKGRCPD